MPDEPAYHCATMLIVVGDRLDPDEVTRDLGVSPDKVWRRGERKSYALPDGSVRTFASINERSGWKRFIADDLLNTPLSDQINHWLAFIQPRETALRRLYDDGA